MNRKDALLTLAKALQEISEKIEGLESDPLEKSEEHEEHMRNLHYAAHYKGARSFGASHRHAHKAAKTYAAKMGRYHAPMDAGMFGAMEHERDAEHIGRNAGAATAQLKRKKPAESVEESASASPAKKAEWNVDPRKGWKKPEKKNTPYSKPAKPSQPGPKREPWDEKDIRPDHEPWDEKDRPGHPGNI